MKKWFLTSLALLGFLFSGVQSSATVAETHCLVPSPTECFFSPPGSIPMSTVVEILKVAKDYYCVSLGHLIQEYRDGNCTITQFASPVIASGSAYTVSYGGGADLIVILGDL